ncbi:hypothetical protein [Bacillus kexueae]|uniref:hypothetical protein n=1 Tax=Aeribacillus kexueae TaxID=2078952 RepID=UPI001FAEEF27|nr:hypothetical protein [Bacillus kexueae]
MKRAAIIQVVFLMFLISGCGNDVLKFRNVLEADQYIRNNAQSLDWDVFKTLLTSDSPLSTDKFHKLKSIPFKEISTSHVVVDNKLYRFSSGKELIYVSEWVEDDGTLKLYDINYLEE